MTEVLEGELVEEDALPTVRQPAPSTALVARDEISIAELLMQSRIVEAAMAEAMKDGVHYGLIPGVKKPTLLKPGAEKLNVLFRLAPSYASEKIWHDDGHLTVIAKCILTHIPTSYVVGEGEGLCSSKEAKYAYRNAQRTCPDCGLPQVRLGKARDGRPGNWYCWRKEGGCGATWDLDSEQAKLFEAMEAGKTANPDLPDTYNTVLKMADKRALVAAVLNCTAASDVFTQDIEDASSPSGAESSTARSRTEKPFDVSRDLLPGAISGQDAPKRLSEALNGMGGKIDWPDVMAQAVQGVWTQKGTWRDLAADDQVMFWCRLSNAVQWITEAQAGREWPSNEEIIGGFAYAFEGTIIELTTAASDAALTAEQQASMGAYGEES